MGERINRLGECAQTFSSSGSRYRMCLAWARHAGGLPEARDEEHQAAEVILCGFLDD
jgi:hypothetical protein